MDDLGVPKTSKSMDKDEKTRLLCEAPWFSNGLSGQTANKWIGLLWKVDTGNHEFSLTRRLIPVMCPANQSIELNTSRNHALQRNSKTTYNGGVFF